MSQELYPLLFEPVLKDYVWGGRHLATVLKRALPPGRTAESWEIAAHTDGTCRVANGRFAGRPLTDLQAELGLDLVGTNSAWAQDRGKFPLLVKLLDATENLSVQVHPDDDYALKHEGNELGKSEMWHVLHGRPGAAVILGVTKGTTPSAFRLAIESGRLEPYLHTIPVRVGDTICVPSGSLHAILGGVLVAEIQQNSNTTYRVYDWNRSHEGRPRPLHVEKAMDVIDFDQIEPAIRQPSLIAQEDGVRRHRLCHNRYFTTELVEIKRGSRFRGKCDGRSLEIWGTVRGRVAVGAVALAAVTFTLLPASLGPFIIAAEEDSRLLRTYVEA